MTRTLPLDVRVLRPRDLVTSLFADALEGDDVAEDHLRWLATSDPVAELAYEAVVVTDLESRFRRAVVT